MKLEKNMYVRTNQGVAKYLGISKETRFDEEYDIYLFDECIFDNWNTIDIDKIDNYKFKASHNIIDLIEVGDYVNGYKISAIYDDDSEVNEYNLKHKKCLGKNIYDEDYQEYLIYEEDIETIVTSQQFESMSYKVGDKEC